MSTKTAPMAKLSSYVQIETKVDETKDLQIFKTLSGNRPPNPQHVKRLADSIRKYGMLINPILVNEKMQVIDGQHRLLAAKEAGSHIYYIIVRGYDLTHVHALNLNQKNWTGADFLEGYANMGIPDYVLLRDFWARHPYYNLVDCIALCSNLSSAGTFQPGAINSDTGTRQVFNEGTWKARDMQKAELDAQNIKLIETYYPGYNRTQFMGTMLLMFRHPNFDFNEFMQKVRLQPTALVDCANREQYKALIEDIYNFRRREKVNLRF